MRFKLLDEFLSPHRRGKRPGGIALQPTALAEIRAALPAGVLIRTGLFYDKSFPVPNLCRCFTVDAGGGDGDVPMFQIDGKALHFGGLRPPGLLAVIEQEMNFDASGIRLEQFSEHGLQGEAVGAHPDFSGIGQQIEELLLSNRPVFRHEVICLHDGNGKHGILR